MRSFGLLLVLLGLASSVVQFMGKETMLLSWIDNWGEGTAWAIRGGCVLLGALLVKLGKPKSKK
jgi:hypothetical protein